MTETARAFAEPPRRSLACTGCGYEVARRTPPERCPMCQRQSTWIARFEIPQPRP